MREFHPAQKSRLVIKETVYFQQPEAKPIALESGSGQDIASDEQPYQRIIKLTESWTPLDTGWVKEASLIVIENQAGKHQLVRPDAKQIQEIAAKVIEIGKEGEAWELVPAGQTRVFTPVELDRIQLRSRSGEVKAIVTVFPK
jgi:hypothetical protein